MRLDEIFTLRGYDMVVAVTLEALNRQLKKLVDSGIINNIMIIEMGADEQGNWKPIVNSSFDQVSKDQHGVPYNPTIFATYQPTMDVTESGSIMQLGVTFISGSIWLRDPFTGNMRPSQDMAGWTLSIPIRAGFAELQNNSTIVPPVARKNLDHFTSAGFAVSRLFCDLQSVDLIGTSPSKITTGNNTNDDIKQMFSFFIFRGYLKYIQEHPENNPYILGYVAKHTSATSSAQDQNVPDSLKPIGNTFNIFYDGGNPARSTLNFILNTKSSIVGPGNHPPTDSFDTSWLSATDISDGKMIYSLRALLESFVLRPFYDTYANRMHEQIAQGGINIQPSNTYDEARKPINVPGGYHYDIHNVNAGNDRYVNSFDAFWSTTSSGVSVNFAGAVSWYKEKHKNVVILGDAQKARAWAGGETSWVATVSIVIQLDDEGKPFLQMTSPELRATGGQTWSDQNGVANSLELMSDLLGKIITVGGLLELFDQNNWITTGLVALGLLKLPTMAKISGVTLDLALSSFSKAIAARIMLPAGDVFYFKTLGVIPDSGATTMLVDYKEEELEL